MSVVSALGNVPPSIQSVVLSAETTFSEHQHEDWFDLSASVVLYFKAIELALASEIFSKYRGAVREGDKSAAPRTSTAADDPYFMHHLKNFLASSRESITLGPMLQILSYLETVDSGKGGLPGHLKAWLRGVFPKSYQFWGKRKLAARISQLADIFRNPATHQKVFRRQEVEELRTQLMGNRGRSGLMMALFSILYRFSEGEQS